MKQLLIVAFVAITFVACNTKETKTETITKEVSSEEPTKTIVVHDQAAPAPEKQNKVEINLSDSGSGIKVRIP